MKDRTVAADGVIPNDAEDLPNGVCRAVYIGGKGSGEDFTVTLADGNSVTFEAMETGFIFPIQVKRVHATGTTVDKIIALY